MARRATEADFQQLKQLLQQDQRSELDEIRAMVRDVEAGALNRATFETALNKALQDALNDGVRASLGQHLADVIRALPDDRRDRLNNELSALLNESMDSRIRAREPAFMDQMTRSASGLVRAGVLQVISELVQFVQQQIQAQLSFKERAQSQFAALRGGASQRDVVLQRAFEGRPVSALWVHRPTGLLIAAADQEGGASFDDKEALKGSLITAIISFADEAMASSADAPNSGLNRLTFGDRTLILAAQPLTVLAVEYDGAPPIGAASWLSAQLARLSQEHGTTLNRFTGDGDGQAWHQLSGELHALLQAPAQDMAAQVAGLLGAGAPNTAGVSAPVRTSVPTWQREMTAAVPMMLLFFFLIGGGFYMAKQGRIGQVETRAQALAAQIGGAAAYDVRLNYALDQRRLTAETGLVLGEETKSVIAASLSANFPFAEIDMSDLTVFERDGQR